MKFLRPPNVRGYLALQPPLRVSVVTCSDEASDDGIPQKSRCVQKESKAKGIQNRISNIIRSCSLFVAFYKILMLAHIGKMQFFST